MSAARRVSFESFLLAIAFLSFRFGLYCYRSSILFLALDPSQPRNLNRYQLLFCKLEPARQRILEDLAKWRFLEVLYDEKEKTVSQSGSKLMFLGGQRQISNSFFQPFDLHS